MPMPAKPDPKKNCEQCGKRMKRNRWSGRLEDMKRFKARRYCNERCMGRAYIKASPTLSAFRCRSRKLRKDACEVCGATKNLGVHHLDENPKNNRRANVWTLCNSCHQIWHWNFGDPSKRRSRRVSHPK